MTWLWHDQHMTGSNCKHSIVSQDLNLHNFCYMQAAETSKAQTDIHPKQGRTAAHLELCCAFLEANGVLSFTCSMVLSFTAH